MQPVAVLDSKGHPTGEFKFDSKGATKILEMLSKHFGIIDQTKSQGIPEARIVPKAQVSRGDMEIFLANINDEFQKL